MGGQVSIKTFTVMFPTEAGFIGRECNSNTCGRYFKVHEDSLRDHMYCPYCAERFEKDQLYTKDQLEHAENQAAELAHEDASDVEENSRYLSVHDVGSVGQRVVHDRARIHCLEVPCGRLVLTDATPAFGRQCGV
jgi:hypothetical protein